MPSCKSGGTVKSRVVNQRGGNMVLRSGTTIETTQVKAPLFDPQETEP